MRYDVCFAEAVGSSPRAHVRDTNVFDAAQDVVMDVNEGPIRSSAQGSTRSRLPGKSWSSTPRTRRCRCEMTGCHQRRLRRVRSLASVAHDHCGLSRIPRASPSSRRSSRHRRSRVTWSLPPTWPPHQSDRQRTQKPAFTQLNHPIEPTSTPRWHHQSPTAYRLFCLLSAIPICSLFDEFVARAWQ